MVAKPSVAARDFTDVILHPGLRPYTMCAPAGISICAIIGKVNDQSGESLRGPAVRMYQHHVDELMFVAI